MHTYVGGRKADLPREVGSTPEGKVNATAQNAGGFLLIELRQKARRQALKKGLLILRRCCDTQLQPREYKIL